MKIINLGRGQGKTTRLLYASEFNDAPILCANVRSKEDLIRRAKEMNLFIPEPICVHEIFSGKTRGNRDFDNGVLVDDTELVLQQMLNNIGCNSEVKAMTVTDKNAEVRKKSLWEARDMVCPEDYYKDIGRV